MLGPRNIQSVCHCLEPQNWIPGLQNFVWQLTYCSLLVNSCSSTVDIVNSLDVLSLLVVIADVSVVVAVILTFASALAATESKGLYQRDCDNSASGMKSMLVHVLIHLFSWRSRSTEINSSVQFVLQLVGSCAYWSKLIICIAEFPHFCYSCSHEDTSIQSAGSRAAVLDPVSRLNTHSRWWALMVPESILCAN